MLNKCVAMTRVCVVYARMMSVLSELLSSRVRAGIFRVLFGLHEIEVHVRELARRAGFSEATVRQELRKLKRLDVVIERRDGNRAYCRANRAHPLYAEIHSLVLKTSGLADVLRDALNVSGVDVAFVFGSIAEGREKAHSDVDLMVIGSIGLRKLTSLLSGVSDELGREINPHIMTRTEYRKRRMKRDHFVTSVLDGERLFIVGGENEFETVGK